MFRRQFENLQFIPRTAGLAFSSFSYEDLNAVSNIKRFSAVWKSIKVIKAGEKSTEVTLRYPTWHEARGKGFTLPITEANEEVTEGHLQKGKQTVTKPEKNLQHVNQVLIMELWKLNEELQQCKRAKSLTDFTA